MTAGVAGAPAVRTDDLRVSFGGVHAVDGVSVSMVAGVVHGIVGPNGSGKSTMLNALTGLVPHTGRVELLGHDVEGWSPAAIRALGVVRSFQTPRVVAELTCEENVLVGASDRTGYGLFGSWLDRWRMAGAERHRVDATRRALAAVGLEEARDLEAGELSYGRVRLLELARALAARPRILLLDEPSAGLNAAETDDLADILLAQCAPDLAIVVIDHKVDMLDRVCDTVTVLEQGRLVASGSPPDIWRSEDVVRAYLGRPPEAPCAP